MPDQMKLVAEITIGDSKSQTKTKAKTIAESEVSALVITSELDNPDSCAITLTQSGAQQHGGSLTLTDPLSIKLSHNDADTDFAFVGEITGLEPTFSGRRSSGGSLVVRGLNALHRLSRGKRSCTYYGGEERNLTDKDIVTTLLKRYPKLKAEFGVKGNKNTQPPEVKYTHVFQHNQTDLEFLRLRAARIGCYILVRDDKLIFSKRDSALSKIKLHAHTDYQKGDDKNVLSLEHFNPRVSTANQVTQVQVRAFIPEQRREMVCIAPDQGSTWPKLGPETGTDATKDMYKDAVVVRVDIPFGTKEEGNAIAMSILNERLLDYVLAEGSLPGDPRIKPGMVVDIVTGDKRFDGPYFITNVRHSYHAKHTPFTTEFRASRDAIDKPSQLPSQLVS